jgi:hypothetical protein
LPTCDPSAARARRHRVRRLALLHAAAIQLAVNLGHGRGARAARERRRRERAIVCGPAGVEVRRWAERAAKPRAEDGRAVRAFHRGACDAGAAADGTLTGLLHDQLAVRTRWRGAHRGGPARCAASGSASGDAAGTVAASDAASRNAAGGVAAAVRPPRDHAGAASRRLQRPAAAAGGAGDGKGERPQRSGRPAPGRDASAVSSRHDA